VSSRTAPNKQTFFASVRDDTTSIRIEVSNHLFDEMVPGRSCYITGARLVLGRDGKRMLNMGRDARVDSCADADCLEPVYDFVKLADICTGEVDTIGIVIDEGNLVESEINGRPTIRRAITLLDNSCCTATLMLWGQRTLDVTINVGDILAISGASCKEYRAEYSLSATDISDIQVNPAIPECSALCKWFSKNRKKTGPWKRPLAASALVQLADILELPPGASLQHIVFRGHITKIHSNCMTYMACDACNKKLAAQGEKWNCSSCNTLTATPSYRYLLRVDISTDDCTAVMTMFHDVAQVFLGPVSDLVWLSNEERNTWVQAALEKEYEFVCISEPSTS
jgi:replication factor A1